MERDRMVGYSNIITKEAFVAPTPSSNHSMLHQTFTHPLLSTTLPPRPPQLKNAMEPQLAPEKTSPEPEFVLPSEVAWPWGVTDQPGSVLSEHFSVDDLLDFDGLENEDEVDNTNCGGGGGVPTAAAAFEAPPLPPPPSDINLPTHDAEEFEWMSSIIDDSIPTYPPCTAAVPRFTPAPLAPVVMKAKRSKRSRRQSWPANPSFSDSSTSSTATFSSSVSSSSSHPGHFMLKYADYELEDIFHEPKKRGRKAHRPAAPQAAPPAVWDKRCTHCGSQQTPQWRAGPAGPKTLCNACGVRYKSGRLVPEYRPTASPTFVPEVHSASHRKVLMMRQRKEEQHRLAAAAGAPPVASF